MAEKIRILITDDHLIFRQSLRMSLQSKSDFEVVGEAVNGQDAIQKVKQLCPDVVLMDIRMPILGGIEATRRIKSDSQRTIIIALSNHADEHYKVEMIKAGAADYMLKTESPSILERSIRRAYSTQKMMQNE